MTYQEALQYLESLTNYEKIDSYDYQSSLKLDRMRRFASILGDPQKGISSIHVAGSKGKGSTSAFIYSILKSAGYKVGLYTSPHLISFRERIRINDSLISEEDLGRLMEAAAAGLSAFSARDMPSFFEVYTALAFLYFKENHADFVVYETGLGGRLDATNIINPRVSIITPISYEHTDKLGATLSKIALEKCGIIKENGICVSSPQEDEALETIDETCKKKNARLILIGRDVKFEELVSNDFKEVFNVDGLRSRYIGIETGLLGSHQIINAATAIAAVEALFSGSFEIEPESVRSGVANVSWRGRLDVVSRDPLIILDGVQNQASANCLTKSIDRIFYSRGRYKKLILVLGISRDKDIEGILSELLPISDSVILTKSKLKQRALEPEKIEEVIIKGSWGKGRGVRGVRAQLTSSVAGALELAQRSASMDDMILVTGSLFVVGEAMEYLKCVEV